jgi:hypothetical protein
MEALNQGFSQRKNTEWSHTEIETEKLTLVAAAWEEAGSVISFLLELFASSFFASPSRSDLVARPTILELELGFFSTGFNLASAPTHKSLEHHQQAAHGHAIQQSEALGVSNLLALFFARTEFFAWQAPHSFYGENGPSSSEEARKTG